MDIVRAYYKADPVKYAKDIEEYLKKAYKTSKNNEPAIYIFEGDRLAAAKDWNKAATMYEQAIYFDEDNPEGYVKYANVYFNTDGGKRFAIQKLVELLQKNPSSALGQRELAEKYYEDGQWTEAAKQYGQYIANPNHFPEDKERYAVLLFTGNNYQKHMTLPPKSSATSPATSHFSVSLSAHLMHSTATAMPFKRLKDTSKMQPMPINSMLQTTSSMPPF